LENKTGFLYTFDGLDGTGKSTLLGLFNGQKINTLNTPPDWMKPYRQSFDESGLESRFLYYASGNVWLDKNITRPLLEKGEIVLLDRSWLSTLAAHELRGLSEEYLRIGLDMAKTCVKPETCYIIHVDKEERKKRLLQRFNINETDKQNMAFEDTMEPAYEKWADRLGWRISFFDNSNITQEEAFNGLSDLILRKNGNT